MCAIHTQLTPDVYVSCIYTPRLPTVMNYCIYLYNMIKFVGCGICIGPWYYCSSRQGCEAIFCFFLCCCVGEVMVYFTVHMITLTLIRWQVAFIY